MALARRISRKGMEEAAAECVRAVLDVKNGELRRRKVSMSSFAFTFNAFSEWDSLHHFRFQKSDGIRTTVAVAWPESKTHTSRNRYAVTPLFGDMGYSSALSFATRWRDLELMFGKPAEHLSEIFWEGLEGF